MINKKSWWRINQQLYKKRRYLHYDWTIIIKVFRFQGKTFYWFCCLFLLSLSSSVSNVSLLLFFDFLFFTILHILYLTRFLKNARTDFHDIFMDGVNWSRKTENNFACDDVTSGPRIWRFSDFEGVIFLTLCPPKRLEISSSNFHEW